MRTVSTIVATFLITAFAALAGGEGWMTDLDKALAKGKAENKPVLVEFTGSDWCPPCIMMREKVFTKKEFIKKASEKFILVELDFPRGDKALALKNAPHQKKYKIEGFPTVILLDEKQKEFTRFYASKYPSISKFLTHLDRSLDRKDLE
ncbi:MAG: thioredoxin family protein [Akkermansiaceae bacterium]|nr:thioredoxin family protein [Akkermansiaceae bacterium]